MGHNSEARQQSIVSTITAIRAEEALAEAARLVVKGHNKKIGDLYRGMKTYLGMSRKDVERARFLADLDEDENRVKSLATFKEVYEALRPGEQVDWLQAAGDAQNQREALATEAVDQSAAATERKDGTFLLMQARTNGKEAGKLGQAADKNPYAQKDGRFNEWAAGWLEGQQSLAPAQAEGTDDVFTGKT